MSKEIRDSSDFVEQVEPVREDDDMFFIQPERSICIDSEKGDYAELIIGDGCVYDDFEAQPDADVDFMKDVPPDWDSLCKVLDPVVSWNDRTRSLVVINPAKTFTDLAEAGTYDGLSDDAYNYLLSCVNTESFGFKDLPDLSLDDYVVIQMSRIVAASRDFASRRKSLDAFWNGLSNKIYQLYLKLLNIDGASE